MAFFLARSRGISPAPGQRVPMGHAGEVVDGTLDPAGERFRRRLASAGLAEALELPLAVHRLYVWPPRRWLGEEQLEELEILNRDDDFELAPESRGGGREELLGREPLIFPGPWG